MKKKSFFYPKKFTESDYRKLFKIARNHCKYVLFNCTKDDCSNSEIIQLLAKYQVQKYERTVLDKYCDADYLFELNSKTTSIILKHSSNIYDWGTQGCPEDLCFLDQEKQYWFSSVVHEGYFDYSLTEENITLLKQTYYSELCPRIIIDIFPLSSDYQSAKLLTIIRRRLLIDYCQFIANSFKSAFRIARHNILSEKEYTIPTFPLINQFADALDLISSICKDNSGDEFEYFSKDFEKDKIQEISCQLEEMESNFSKFVKVNNILATKYFNGCANAMKKEYERQKEMGRTAAPWDRIFAGNNAVRALKASKDFLKMSEVADKISRTRCSL